MWKTIVLVVVFMFSPGGGIFHSLYKNVRVSVPHKGNIGEPLFLTPYIEAGKLEEAKKQSLVPPFPGSNVKSYAGYITVNKTYNSNIFFWFFPAQVQPMAAPVVLWLQGGPGGSSMFGLFVEHGPYIVTSNMTVSPREFPWTTTFSMLYIDNPVGTGFSFTDDPQGYAVNEDDVARNLYSALTHFFLLFPEYKNNDFYATGESYAGKYVPALAHYIHALNPVMTTKINLKGVAIGDAYSDPESIIGGYATFLYQIGLLDEKQRKYFQKQCDDCVKYIREERWFQAFEVLDKLLDGDLTNNPSYFQNVTGCPSYYNLLQCKEPEDQNYYGKFLSLPQVRQAIHVGNRTFSDGSQVEKYMREDTVKSVKLWLAEIMDNYKVLIYNGQLDIIVAASLTERSLMAMKWKGSRKYKQAERKVWKIFKSDNEVAGYVRQVDDFCQVIVRGGGHILPYDQPLRSFDMINRFVFERGWDPY
ncbi:probable serine carboxypeptidase CPVL isoform X1 [Panthera tigris]|uniref:probable serine carboxypeptidase CPVL isoform X1 n=1 Tax=Panthera tigris TaxID=9694 RepID=UPI001C6F8036|nr:probable serine carboxypeptidase CPVL isoform X1 [Panthera tigris]XP_042824965.1 probable serine carboxypeptidase CPVL isoform X1 [Panthera tigris]XP_042824972.1 probable serine carboxypeptidase CPVL isoform X1 [Panthera tigris]XP_042824980.1 probable serine carboxypeptidase CPVL isoform X1 [Panthera tigris]XP_042824989.1 probable serine carboxypeptidase CPVL isoform X1 [Panthera tigris]XP_042824996.1 probable serine carboxypeptidase CPVL isoform X1 [Panthera tigris]XP_042825001.1 probable